MRPRLDHEAFQVRHGQLPCFHRLTDAKQALAVSAFRQRTFQTLPVLVGCLTVLGKAGRKCAANPGLTPSFRRSLPETGCLSQGLPHGKRYAWPCPQNGYAPVLVLSCGRMTRHSETGQTRALRTPSLGNYPPNKKAPGR